MTEKKFKKLRCYPCPGGFPPSCPFSKSNFTSPPMFYLTCQQAGMGKTQKNKKSGAGLQKPSGKSKAGTDSLAVSTPKTGNFQPVAHSSSLEIAQTPARAKSSPAKSSRASSEPAGSVPLAQPKTSVEPPPLLSGGGCGLGQPFSGILKLETSKAGQTYILDQIISDVIYLLNDMEKAIAQFAVDFAKEHPQIVREIERLSLYEQMELDVLVNMMNIGRHTRRNEILRNICQ